MIPTFRTLRRLGVMGRAFARHDLLFLLTERPLSDLAIARVSGFALGLIFRRRSKTARRPGERLAAALAEVGPSFIKLGQALSTRSDLLGEEICADLAQLQDKLPPFDSAKARAIVEAELGRPLADAYSAFDDTPVAAGSIAQVHFARTSDGRDVAVKVLRPGVEKRFAEDIALFRTIAESLDLVLPELRRLRLPEVVATFEETTRLEMDLRMEAAAAAEFAENLKDLPGFRVPAIDWQRTARRVLTMERVIGIQVGDRAALEAAGADFTQLLTVSAQSFFLQVFRDGYFHADMHPGNMFVEPPSTILPIDFGIMGRLDIKSRRFLAEMLIGFLDGDYRRVADVHVRAGYLPAGASVDAFTQAVRSIGEPIRGLPLQEISFARLLAQLFEVTELFRMETQPQLLLLQKTMMQAEGMGRLLDPKVNMWELARPLVEDWFIANLGPQARLKTLVRDTAESIERLPHLLTQAERLVDTLANRGLSLDPDTTTLLRGGRRRGWPLAWLGTAAAFLAGLLLGLAL